MILSRAKERLMDRNKQIQSILFICWLYNHLFITNFIHSAWMSIANVSKLFLRIKKICYSLLQEWFSVAGVFFYVSSLVWSWFCCIYCFENIKAERSFEVRTSSVFSIVQMFLSSHSVCQCFSHLSQQVKIVSTMQTHYSVSLPKLKKDTIHLLYPCQRLTALSQIQLQ